MSFNQLLEILTLSELNKYSLSFGTVVRNLLEAKRRDPFDGLAFLT
jgi:hypothetical protein